MRRFLALLLMLGVLAGLLGACSGDDKRYSADRFDVDLAVQSAGPRVR